MKHRACYKPMAVAIMAIFMAALGVAAQGLQGNWHGVLDAGLMKLNISLRFTAGADGALQCVLLSPDQTDQEIPAKIAYQSADSIAVDVPMIRASYSARIEGDTMAGALTQMGHKLPLTLTRGQMVINRPQTPRQPLPYATEEFAFLAPDSVQLAGTLTYPVGYSASQQPTVVVMVTGSGAQNRDEELFQHRPFAVIADALARQGVATLRYDDRGVGASAGTQQGTTVHSNMADALAAVAAVKATGKFGRVGLLGHSEGGLIAYMAAQPQNVDFILSIAGPAMSGSTLLAQQLADLCRLTGKSEAETQATLAQQKATLAMTADPWLKSFVTLDPAPYIRAIAVPMFVLQGAKDAQVNPELNGAAIKENFPISGPALRFELYPGLNHLLQPADTGLPTEYGQIDITIDPQPLQDIVDFVLSQK